MLRDVLKSRGVEVVMTRTTDTHLALVKAEDYKLRCALEKGCDLAISCHRNAGPTTARGVEIWLHSQAGASIVNWASDIINGMTATGIPIRKGDIAPGVYRGYPSYPNDNFYCNSGTKSPSMLVELGFITNEQDNLVFDSRIEEMVLAIADAACRRLGVDLTPPAQSKLYRVQVGAFSQKQNAERLAEELRGKGYQTIIKAE